MVEHKIGARGSGLAFVPFICLSAFGCCNQKSPKVLLAMILKKAVNFPKSGIYSEYFFSHSSNFLHLSDNSHPQFTSVPENFTTVSSHDTHCSNRLRTASAPSAGAPRNSEPCKPSPIPYSASATSLPWLNLVQSPACFEFDVFNLLQNLST